MIKETVITNLDDLHKGNFIGEYNLAKLAKEISEHLEKGNMVFLIVVCRKNNEYLDTTINNLKAAIKDVCNETKKVSITKPKKKMETECFHAYEITFSQE